MFTKIAGSAAAMITLFIMDHGAVAQTREHAELASATARIDLEADGLPIEELLQKLGAASRRLTCSDDVATIKLHVRLRGRTIADVKDALAELVQGEWIRRPDDDREELRLKRATREKMNRWWQTFEAVRARAVAVISRSWLTGLGSQLVMQDDAARPALEQDLFRNLPVALLERAIGLFNGASFYAVDTIGFSTEDDESVASSRLADLPLGAVEALHALHQLYPRALEAPLKPSDVLRLGNGGWTLWATVRHPRGIGSRVSASTSATPRPLELEVMRPDHAGLPKIVKSLGSQADHGWRELAEYARGQVWDRPVVGSAKQPPVRRTERLRALTRQERFDVIADYHSRFAPTRPLRLDSPASGEAGGLGEKLDELCSQSDSSWKKTSSGIVLVRSNRWYRDDRLEVPSNKERQLLARLSAISGLWRQNDLLSLRLLLDFHMEAVRGLNSWQIANGLRWSSPEDRTDPEYGEKTIVAGASGLRDRFPFQALSLTILRSLKTLDFYSRLSVEQRNLSVGGQLRVALLSDALMSIALDLVPELADRKREEGTVLRIQLVGSSPGKIRLSLAP